MSWSRQAAALATVTALACATPQPAPPPPAPMPSAPATRLVTVTPDQLQGLLSAPGARATLVNVWATWCEPCVKEFPDILRAGRDNEKRGVRTMFVSADFEEERGSAEAFLKKQGVDFTTYFKSGDDQAFIDALSKSWSGSIPVTLIFDAQGNLRFFREGELDYAGVNAALDAVLD